MPFERVERFGPMSPEPADVEVYVVSENLRSMMNYVSANQ